MRTFREDYANGTQAEAQVFQRLREFLPNIKRTKAKCPVDFVQSGENKYLIELKTRTNAKDTYPTTLMPLNKLIYIQNRRDYTGIFLFNFTDGLFGVNVNDLVRDENYTVAPFRRNRRADFNDVSKLYLHINVDVLRPYNQLFN